MHYTTLSTATTTITTTLHYATLHHTTLRYTPLTTATTTSTSRLFCTTLDYDDITLRYSHYTTTKTTATTTTAALHHTTSTSCRWGDHCNLCNHSIKQNSNHLSVHQWICSATRASQQPTSPTGLLFWNFCHCLVRCYWYLHRKRIDR